LQSIAGTKEAARLVAHDQMSLDRRTIMASQPAHRVGSCTFALADPL